MSQSFTTGQRWISMTEPDLGLGLITEVENRRISIVFPAAEEERTYAMDNAPLSRVRHEVGDSITLPEQQKLIVREVHEQLGCLIYMVDDGNGQLQPLPEQMLPAEIELHGARDRLLSGQLDDPRRFMLRVKTLEAHNRARANASRGLLGPRVDLIPHQFYITQQLAGREHPRALLADEVGLGKTIEAGLILHRLYLDERVKRALILVPESLVHQWLVEMRRRFNLHFSIFDAQRCEDMEVAVDEEESPSNPFETEQLILASIDWLANDESRNQQLAEAGWDMLIIDEAHHLQWEENTTPSAKYQLAETLCAATPSVLLLTATPENAGIEGHFARLRLLDPARYGHLQDFKDEQAGYSQINSLIQQLLNDPAGDHPDASELLGEELAGKLRADPQHYQREAINTLLDRFGTGRSLFRNSRSSVGGFPKRQLHEHQLHADSDTLSIGDWAEPATRLGSNWVEKDPRVRWLEQFLLQRPDDRALLICADAQTAMDLELFIRLRRGIASSVFHEGMSLFERDRAAAYFADSESGAQLLVCSEIGSEGRNFQFAEHLILFDLPLDPDLLEQRIGRLDRINRNQDVHIHVPYIPGTEPHHLLQWYRDALSIFTEPCTIGAAMMSHFADELASALGDEAHMQNLSTRAAEKAASLREELHSGRNQLLELNSCRREEAQQLIEILDQEQRGEALGDYLEQLADQFGLEHEDHSEQTIILRPGDHMLTESFPHLPEEGLTGTFNRQRALQREDIAYLTWEHPLVREAMEMIVSSDFGNTCVNTISVKGLPAGSLLLETFLHPVIHAPSSLQLDRDLPAMSARLLTDNQGRQLSDKVSHEQLNTLCQTIKRKLIPTLMRQLREPLATLVLQIEATAAELEIQWREQACKHYRERRQSERNRLSTLAQRNPMVNDDELQGFDQTTEQGLAALGNLKLNLGALRLAIVS